MGHEEGFGTLMCNKPAPVLRCCDLPGVSLRPSWAPDQATSMERFSWFKNGNSFGNLNFRLQVWLFGPLS